MPIINCCCADGITCDCSGVDTGVTISVATTSGTYPCAFGGNPECSGFIPSIETEFTFNHFLQVTPTYCRFVYADMSGDTLTIHLRSGIASISFGLTAINPDCHPTSTVTIAVDRDFADANGEYGPISVSCVDGKLVASGVVPADVATHAAATTCQFNITYSIL